MGKRSALLAVAAVAAMLPGSGAVPVGAQSSAIRVIGVANASGRRGVYFVPPAKPSGSVPVLVLLHPTGTSGITFIPAFITYAQKRGFVIIAPDSGIRPDGVATWEVGDRPGQITDDLKHVVAALDWVRTKEKLRIDRSHVLIAGFSGGGSSAPYIATNRLPFTHAAVLHAGVFPASLGGRRLPMWFSTGTEDEYAPPAEVKPLADELRRYQKVEFHTYPSPHRLTAPEKDDLIRWWLGR
jgi:poly(3-hydroxybutyrate) depolymerase